jgi:hypothetical protein
MTGDRTMRVESVVRSSHVLSAFVSAACALATLPSRPARADQVDACIATAEEAQRLRQSVKLIRSREKLVACSQAACPTVVRSDCSRWLAEVDELVPSLVLRAVDSAGADLTDVVVTVDGQVIAERLDGSEIHVDPGQHVFRLTRAGAPPIEQNVLIREGEQHRTLSVVCPGPVSVPPQEGGAVGAEPKRADVDLQPPMGAPSPSRVPLAWPISAIGAGGLAFAGASYLWISGLNARAALVSGCGVTRSCSPSDVDSARRTLVIGDVTAGAGVALVALGVGILLLGRTPAARAVAVAIHPVPGGALLGVSGNL